MGWRDVLDEFAYVWCTEDEDTRPPDMFGACLEAKLQRMPPADRIAMARELLQGTEWEVAQPPRISGWQPAKRCKYAGYSQTLRISSNQRQACGCDNCKRVLFGVGRGAI